MAWPQDHPTTTGKAATSRSNRAFLLLISAISLLAVGLFVLLAFGQVYGSEFSPVTFQRRTYMFFQVPFLRQQVTPTWHDDATQNLEKYLQKQGLLPRHKSPNRWDGVWVSEMAERNARLTRSF